MIKRIIWLIFIVILSTVCISIYLQPNDLKDCGSIPGDKPGCQIVDAIVAVSGGDTEARVEEAVKLFNNGWASKLILSGAAQDKTGPSNAAAMKDMAVQSGVPALSIWLDEYSENTKENAQNTKTIFAELDIESAILVTSGYHQRRASLEFEQRNNTVKILSYPVTADNDWSWHWFVSPRGWWLALGEVARIIVFYVLGLF
jgi:uncharacterized SAM-binding protein YcdF (DUF218 family)